MAVADKNVARGTGTTSKKVGEVSIVGVEKIYHAKNGTSFVPALSGVNLTIEPGEFVAIVGTSGCGKSTLLRILAGFEDATAGQVSVSGNSVAKPGSDRGVVFQDYALFPWLTVHENIAFGPRERGLSRKKSLSEAQAFMELVGLEAFSDKYPNQLSGGMKQRVAIARVLANRPDVLLMDEPFGALDALTRSTMQNELARIHKETGTTVVFVTHSIEEAIYLSNRVVVMFGGAARGIPGKVVDIVPVNLDDRDSTSPQFNLLEKRISSVVLGEGS